jgi:hypothetical protein
MGLYGTVAAGAAGVARRLNRRPPERITAWDVLLFGVATHKLSRMLSKDSVTSPLRAPFTRYVEPSAPAELSEEVPEDSVVEHAVGELITCPFCLAQWVATGFSIGWIFAPRATKLIASTFSSVAVADFLQFGYAAAQRLED